MTDKLDFESRNNLVQYRLQRAHESLEEAEYNAKGQYYNAAINRLYYACFYAAIALLLQNQIEAGTHKGVKTLLGLHFISNGKLEGKYGVIYQQLFNNRQSGDYEDFIFCDVNLFNDLFPQAKDFVTKMESLIQTCKSSSSPQ